MIRPVGRPPNEVLTGVQFGTLLVIGFGYRTSKAYFWKLRCTVCNTECYSSGSDLKRGRRGACEVCRDKKSKNSPYLGLYGNYKRNAINRSHEWSISFDDFCTLISINCHYCNSPPLQKYKKKGARCGIIYNGIDRKDNKLGYVGDNVVSCCKFCNWAKSRWEFREFEEWLNRVRGPQRALS
jgi:hypothetical protein